jgi:acyl-CoA-binding protein
MMTQKKKIKLEVDKHYLYIRHRDKNKVLRYDLKKAVLQKKANWGWQETSRQYAFFRDCSIADIECDDEKFVNFIEKQDLIKWAESLGSKTYEKDFDEYMKLINSTPATIVMPFIKVVDEMDSDILNNGTIRKLRSIRK